MKSFKKALALLMEAVHRHKKNCEATKYAESLVNNGQL